MSLGVDRSAIRGALKKSSILHSDGLRKGFAARLVGNKVTVRYYRGSFVYEDLSSGVSCFNT